MSDLPPSAAAPPAPDRLWAHCYVMKPSGEWDWIGEMGQSAVIQQVEYVRADLAAAAAGEGGSSPGRHPVDIPTLKQVVVDAHDSAIQDPGCKHCRRTASILTGGALDALDRGLAASRERAAALPPTEREVALFQEAWSNFRDGMWTAEGATDWLKREWLRAVAPPAEEKP